MISLLTLALAIQTVAGAQAPQTQRVSEQLHYLAPVYACNREVARQQARIFQRRCARRIEALRQKEAAVLGPDPGYEIIALGLCARSTQVMSAGFAKALRAFDKGLAALEARYP